MQHPCGVTNATRIEGHVDNLALHLRRLPLVAIVQEEGTTGTALCSAAVSLLALTSLPMADEVGPVTIGAVQDLDNHEATRSRWGYSASETLMENSTSTPVRHLRLTLRTCASNWPKMSGRKSAAMVGSRSIDVATNANRDCGETVHPSVHVGRSRSRWPGNDHKRLPCRQPD